MKYGYKKLLLPLIFLGLLFFLFSKSLSFAQTPGNYDVTVSPVFFDLSSNPGSTITDKIRIRNNTTSPLALKLVVKRLTGDNFGDLTLNDENSDNSLSWLQFNNQAFVATPLEWTDVPFSLQIPKNAAFGYYFAITFEQDNKSPLAKIGAKITGAVAVPILLNVRKDGAKAQVKIVNFSTQNFINEYLPVDFNVRVENTGNIHARPHGNIFITDGSGKDISILDVNSTFATLIPNTQKSFTSSWIDGFLVKEPVMVDGEVKLDKNGKLVQKITINWDKLTSFRIGKYTANLLMVYDNGSKDIPLESTVTFWIIPYKPILIAIATIIIVIFIFRILLKNYIRRELKRRQN